jgi:hypothetical protein
MAVETYERTNYEMLVSAGQAQVRKPATTREVLVLLVCK